MPLPQQAGADLVCFSCDRGAKGLGDVPLSIDALETSIVNGWSTGISKYDYGLCRKVFKTYEMVSIYQMIVADRNRKMNEYLIEPNKHGVK